MALVLAIKGRQQMCDVFLRMGTPFSNVLVRLYVNDYTPTDGMVIGDFTEATFPGYASQMIPAGSWSAPTDDGVCSTIQAPILLWQATGASSEFVFGYYVTSGGDLIWAERFPSPVPMLTPGATLGLTPRFQCRTGSPC